MKKINGNNSTVVKYKDSLLEMKHLSKNGTNTKDTIALTFKWFLLSIMSGGSWKEVLDYKNNWPLNFIKELYK